MGKQSSIGSFDRNYFQVDPDIRLARSLPSEAFNDPEFLQLELQTLFRTSWLFIPPFSAEASNRLKEAGGNAPFKILETPLFLQRDLEGKLHCFPNVCTHAWHPLVESSGIVKSIVCPQHGRRFDCKGKFVSHQGFNNLPGFPGDTDHLGELPVFSRDIFTFVALSNHVEPLDSHLVEVWKSVEGLKLTDLGKEYHDMESRVVDGNWKQHAWNYMDNYHIRFVHKGPEGLAGAIHLSSYRTELFGRVALQWAYAKRPDDGFEPELLSPRFRDPRDPSRRVFALWWFVFPNLTLNFYPWGISVNVYNPIPGDPNRTEFQWYHYVLDEEKYARKDISWLDRRVDSEDLEAITNVHHSAKSGFAPRGRFAPNEELGPHWLHRLIYESIFESGSIKA